MRFYVYEGDLKKKIDIRSYDERNEFNTDISRPTSPYCSVSARWQQEQLLLWYILFPLKVGEVQ